MYYDEQGMMFHSICGFGTY